MQELANQERAKGLGLRRSAWIAVIVIVTFAGLIGSYVWIVHVLGKPDGDSVEVLGNRVHVRWQWAHPIRTDTYALGGRKRVFNGTVKEPAVRVDQSNLASHSIRGRFLWETGFGWNFNLLEGKISQSGAEYDLEFVVGNALPPGCGLECHGNFDPATRIFVLKVIEQMEDAQARQCSLRFRIDHEGKVSFLPEDQEASDIELQGQ